MKNVLFILKCVFGLFIISIFISPSVFADTTTEYPEIYIRAINPGYTIDGVANTGEMIELARSTPGDPLSLAGLSIGYTNSSGESFVLMEFPENSWLVGESILLRLASSPGSELAAVNYKSTRTFRGLAFSAALDLKRDGTILDSVCWTGKNDCYPAFKSANPKILLRDSIATFIQVDSYEPVYDENSYFVEEEEKPEILSQCKGLLISEVLSYYDESREEQFIELYNSSSEQILLDGCSLEYKNKLYPLSGIMKPDAYKAEYRTDFTITKNPTNFVAISLIDTTGESLDRLELPHGQKRATSYAWIGYQENGARLYETTFLPTPSEPNIYQEYRTCEEGKIINEETGNCVKATIIEEKTCPTGQYLNPLTNRCKKVEEEKVTTCKEGYELNPETGKCKKIKVNNGADYSLATSTFEEKSSFIALYAVLGVVVLGLIYVIYEFRQEIAKLFRKVFRRSR